MPKRIRRNYPIYIAPKILGYYENNSPKAYDEKNVIELNPNNTDDKILIYERQVTEWFLNRASRLIKGTNNGFIILMICLSYLEGVEQYRQGRTSNEKSKEFFRNSIHRIYPNTFNDIELNELYKEARCGLFHNGMVSGKIIINNSFNNAIDFADSYTIKINPKKLLSDINNDYKCYISELKDNENHSIRNKFNDMFYVVPDVLI